MVITAQSILMIGKSGGTMLLELTPGLIAPLKLYISKNAPLIAFSSASQVLPSFSRRTFLLTCVHPTIYEET